ncbi:hypothetical protein LCGC14_2843030, partial [marine sediment metagenome]
SIPDRIKESSRTKNLSSPDTHILTNELESTSRLNSYIVSANITNNALVRSTEYINISFSPSVPALEYVFGDILNDPYINTNQTNLSSIILDFPELQQDEYSRDIEILLHILNSSNETEQIEYFSFVLDDNWVKIVSINEDETKIIGGQEIIIELDPDPRTVPDSIGGIAWRWDSDGSSSNSKIFSPFDDGEHILYLLITDPVGRVNTPEPLVYHYYVDNSAPEIVPLNDFAQFLPAGSEITFQNQSPIDTGDPFTDIISWTFYFPILNLTFENTWAVVPAPADTYEFRVTARDRLNNTAQTIYAIKASIAILGTSINKFDSSKPNVPLLVNISETPATQNYTWIDLLSNTIYSTNTTSPQNTPNATGDYTLFISVTDSTGGSASLSKQILIDNSSMKFS